MADKKKLTIKQLLAELKAFAVQLANGASSQEATSPFVPSHAFSIKEYGWLALSGEEGERYSGIIAGLLAYLDEAMSESSVAKLVQTAILKTLDLNKEHQSESASLRADQAISEVQLALSSPHLKWVSCIPILGITPPKRAWVINNVSLINITRNKGKSLLRAADRITDSTVATNDDKSRSKAENRKHLIEEHPGQAFALVTTLALDAEAAWSSAKRRLRFTLDCLNLAVDFLHGSNHFCELSIEEPRRRHYASGLTMNVTDHAQRHSATGRYIHYHYGGGDIKRQRRDCLPQFLRLGFDHCNRQHGQPRAGNWVGHRWRQSFEHQQRRHARRLFGHGRCFG